MAFDWTAIGGLLARGEPLFRFIHGLAFFALGIALLLLAPRAARLEIARRLPLLTIFGFCEAVAAWDGALAPALGVGRMLPPLGHTLVAGTGYAAVLAFGLLASIPPGRRSRVRARLAVLIPAGWLAGLLALLLAGVPTPEAAAWGELAARYGLALPGGMFAAWGLRYGTYRTMDPQMLRLAKGPLRTAGVSLGLFGLLSGLQVVADRLTFPLSIPYALCGIALAGSLVYTLNVIQQEIERWIEGVERSQALMADRERISRDLHDGIIQSIYAAGLMLEGVMQTIPDDPDAAQTQLAHTMASLNQTIQDIRRYIFDLRGGVPEADLESGLAEMLRDFRVNTLLETQLTIEGEETRPLGAEQRGHIFQIVREALSNTARHARARKVEVQLSFDNDALRLRIADDGVGLGRGTVQGGQGLRNIRERARLLDGTLDIDSAPGQGVTLTLTVPLKHGTTSR